MDIVKDTSFEIGWLAWQARPPRPSLTVVVKGTFDLVPSGECPISELQALLTGDEYHDGDIERSTRYASDLALLKPRAECLLMGSYRAPMEGYWRGDEEIELTGLHPVEPLIRCRLPGVRPRVFLHCTGAEAGLREVALNLDTITLDADTLRIDGDEQRCTVVWRAAIPISSEAALQSLRIMAAVQINGEQLSWI
ncbi:MAG: DUF2169 domain-containing protein, partial [Byssovorax sp.]